VLLLLASLAFATSDDVSWWQANGPIKCTKQDTTIGPQEVCCGNFAIDVEQNHDPLSAEVTCRGWCSSDGCKLLGGNLTQECGLCSAKAKCGPEAPDFMKYKDRTTGNNEECRATCKVTPCIGLMGDPLFECGGCDPEGEGCHPKAEHFGDWAERRTHDESRPCLAVCSTTPCTGLINDPRLECGGCAATAEGCHPKAEHYDDWLERHAGKKEL